MRTGLFRLSLIKNIIRLFKHADRRRFWQISQIQKFHLRKSAVKSVQLCAKYNKSMQNIHTERLLLSPFAATDAAFIFELLNTPTWIQFIGERNINTLEDAENYIVQKMMPSYIENGFGFCAVKLKENELPILPAQPAGDQMQPYLAPMRTLSRPHREKMPSSAHPRNIRPSQGSGALGD